MSADRRFLGFADHKAETGGANLVTLFKQQEMGGYPGVFLIQGNQGKTFPPSALVSIHAKVSRIKCSLRGSNHCYLESTQFY